MTFTSNHLSLLHLPHPCFKEHPATDLFSSDDLSKDSLRSPLMTPQLLIIHTSSIVSYSVRYWTPLKIVTA